MAIQGAGMYGYLKYRVAGKPSVSYEIVRRTPSIDGLLRRNGYDPDTINRADTPLVGADCYATIRVLCRSFVKDGPLAWGAPYDDEYTVPSEASLYDLVLAEPAATPQPTSRVLPVQTKTLTNIIGWRLSVPVEFPRWFPTASALVAMSKNSASMKWQSVAMPELGMVAAPEGLAIYDLTVNPMGPILTETETLSDADLLKPGAYLGIRGRTKGNTNGTRSMSKIDAQASASLTSNATGEGPTQPNGVTSDGGGQTDDPNATFPLGLDGDPRFMHWGNLHVRSLRELRISAASLLRDIYDGHLGRPRPDENDDALYVVELVDSRFRLRQSMATAIGNNDLIGYGEDGKIITDAGASTVVGGTALTCFNMLADVPIQFNASTVSQTLICRRAVSVLSDPPSEDRSPTLDATVSIGSIVATAPTYVQRPFTVDEILGAFASTLTRLVGQAIHLDTSLLEASIAGNAEEIFDPLIDDGDIINLDFSSMTIAQALDFFAQRLGGCWLWERSSGALVFSFVDGPPMVAAISDTPTDTATARAVIPSIEVYLDQNKRYRTLGNINTVSEMVPLHVAIQHPTYYCARYGPIEKDVTGEDGTVFCADFDVEGPCYEGGEKQDKYLTLLHYVDCRAGETVDGVVSTSWITGLNSRNPEMAQYYPAGGASDRTWITVVDHIPALVGNSTNFDDSPDQMPGVNVYKSSLLHRDKRFGLGSSRMKLDDMVSSKRSPWNYNSRTLRTAFVKNITSNTFNAKGRIGLGLEADQWGTQGGMVDPGGESAFDTSLERRRTVYISRLQRLRRVVDGDASYIRLPPRTVSMDTDGNIIFDGCITPSVGLQNESIVFGTSEHVGVRYRIWGSRFDSRIMPYGASVNAVANGSTALAPTVGAPTIRVRQKSSGTILRSFLCRFEAFKEISTKTAKQFETRGPNNEATEPKPFVWLYKFVEVIPDNNPEAMLFDQNDHLGWQTNAIGYALNICEMNYRDVKSKPGQDGGPSTAEPYAPTFHFDGSQLSFTHGEDAASPLVLPTPPGGYCICYEIANRLGFSSYYLFAQNGIEVVCPPRVVSLVPPDTDFLYMGGSGVGKQQPTASVSDAILNA